MESDSDRADASYRNRWQLRSVIVGTALLTVAVVLYRDFVFGDRTLLYKDIGSDALNVFYPSYVLRSEYFRHVGLFSWSFQVGMGQNIFPSIGALLLTPVIWLPKAMIAKAIVYQHLLYVLISGLLFARFLADRGLAFGSCLLGALLLSFSAYMCMGSCWFFHAYEVVCFTFLLFTVEQAVAHGRWPLLVLGVAVVGLLGAFHFFLCALLLCLYVPVRLLDRSPWQRAFRKAALLAAAAFLGVGLMAIVTLGSFYALINSPRGSGPTSLLRTLSSTPIFTLESSLHYMTAILRPFANDMLGTGSDFRGWQNYLEAPMSYCGLVSLILLPQAFVKTTWRRRIIYALFLGALVLTTVFPWFRYLFWGFSGDYYRALSLFSIFGVITLGMTAFSRYSAGNRLNLWLLVATSLILIGVLSLPIPRFQALITPGLKLAAAIFLASYGMLLIIGQLLRQQRIIVWLTIALVAAELLYFDRITVTRPAVTKQELNERVGYNDATVDAVRDIKSSDPSFFRITKTWGSGLGTYQSLNDSLVFGYYGTISYSSFNNLNYIKFLMAVDAISPEEMSTYTHWSLGLLGHPLLSTFACEKYVLTKDPVPYQASGPYEFVKNYDTIYLFQNRFFLPLGLTFSRYLPEELFLRLPSGVKPGALLHAVVLEDKDFGKKQGLSELTFDELKQLLNTSTPSDTISLRRSTGLDIHSFRESQIEGTVHVDANSILVLQTPFDPGWRASVDNRSVPVCRVDAGLLGIAVDSGEHAVKLKYVPAFLSIGAAISLCSLAILAVFWWKWPRLSLVA
jgi:uncharacterized membrane protein YfhO